MMARSYFILPTIFLVASFFSSESGGQIIPELCATTIGGFHYNLTDLAGYFSTADATTVDFNNNVYYFRPCQVLLNTNCQKAWDSTPAGCQRDTNRPPLYHDLGPVDSVQFSQLPNSGPDQVTPVALDLLQCLIFISHLTLLNTSAEIPALLLSTSFGLLTSHFHRASCCRSAVAKMVDASKWRSCANKTLAKDISPPRTRLSSRMLDYHLQWRTAYACPTNANCCLYEYSKEPEKTKALCLDNSKGNEQCPESLGSYEFIGQWQVDNCSDCYFHDRRSNGQRGGVTID
jgi:hypothetical protein